MHEKYLQPLIQKSGFLSSIKSSIRRNGFNSSEYLATYLIEFRRGVQVSIRNSSTPVWLDRQSDCQGCQADRVIVADLIQSFQHQPATLQRRRCVLLELQGGDEERCRFSNGSFREQATDWLRPNRNLRSTSLHRVKSDFLLIIHAMLRLVLDTNVVLDLFHWANTDAVPIMAALEGGQVECLADERTLDELQRVLTYPQLKLTPEMAVDRYRRYSGLVRIFPEGEAPPLPRCKDRDDQKFLELAARCAANILVTKDKALLRLRGRTTLGFRILKPAAASALLPPAPLQETP